jgi:hypothetical protein
VFRLKRKWPHHVKLPAENVRGFTNIVVISCAAGVPSATSLTYSLPRDDSGFVVGREDQLWSSSSSPKGRSHRQSDARGRCLRLWPPNPFHRPYEPHRRNARIGTADWSCGPDIHFTVGTNDKHCRRSPTEMIPRGRRNLIIRVAIDTRAGHGIGVQECPDCG